MSRSQKRLGYLLAVLGCAAVLALRLSLEGVLAEQARLLPFVLAVMAAGWWGGFGPGIAATLLGVLLGVWFIVPPQTSLRIETVADGVNAVVFLVTGVTISLLCEALHRAQRRETEKQFHTLADSMPQLVWMARPDGFRFWFNRRWYEYTGASPHDLMGLDWPRYCGDTDGPRVLASWQQAVARGQTWEETYPLRRCDGQYRWHLARAVPIIDERGGIICWFGTSTDVEERIQGEQVLKDADAHKNQFLATLAHELRNPLAPISNALALWPYIADDKAEMEHLRGILDRQTRQLVRLIDDLMDLSRITQGKICLRRETFDLGSIVHAAVETVQPLIAAGEHHLCVSVPDEPIYVDGDMARLTQVFSNLLNNAAKYSVRNGQIDFTVEAIDGQAVARVRDNGLGIPPAMLEQIFDAFHQLDATPGRSHGGLGIGLWLARQLVELHGGHISATSAGPGQGSEFVVSLPTTTAPTEQPHNERTKAGSTSTHQPREILVVDDLVESADTLVMVLMSLGHHAVGVNDGQSAIRWIADHHPEVVFLDIAMPGTDGFEVARQVRACRELDDVVLVALTGLGLAEDRRRVFAAGFNSHLTKPTSVSALRSLLSQLPTRRVEAATP